MWVIGKLVGGMDAPPEMSDVPRYAEWTTVHLAPVCPVHSPSAWNEKLDPVAKLYTMP